MTRISIIVPVFNEVDNLPALREHLEAVFCQLPEVAFEVLLVDDHSTDGSDAAIAEWRRQSPLVASIRFSRNFGSHSAISAGLSYCRGDCAVLLAADMQDPPQVIPELMDRWKAGFDVVWATRTTREGESWPTRLFSSLYYRLMRRLALKDMPSKGADFMLMDRKVIAAYNAIPEKNTSLLAMVLWLGFRQTSIEYVKKARERGHSKWTLAKKLKLFVDSVVSFSFAPIRLTSLAGIGVSLLGFLYAIWVVGNSILGHPTEGWSSLMVVVLLLGGFQLLMLGILGEYLWRAFDEARGRPRYVVESYVAAAEHGAPRREGPESN